MQNIIYYYSLAHWFSFSRTNQWSLISMAIVTGFWGIWYLVKGTVPIVQEVNLWKNIMYPLPFSITRFSDIFFSPIWICLLFYIGHLIKNCPETPKTNVEKLVDALVAGIFKFGLRLGLVPFLILFVLCLTGYLLYLCIKSIIKTCGILFMDVDKESSKLDKL